MGLLFDGYSRRSLDRVWIQQKTLQLVKKGKSRSNAERIAFELARKTGKYVRIHSGGSRSGRH